MINKIRIKDKDNKFKGEDFYKRIIYKKNEMDSVRLKYTKSKCDNPIWGLTAAYALKKNK